MFPRVAFAHRKVTLMTCWAVMLCVCGESKRYLAAQGHTYMLACKSRCPRLSRERQSSESSWFCEGQACVCANVIFFCFFAFNVTAVLLSCSQHCQSSQVKPQSLILSGILVGRVCFSE